VVRADGGLGALTHVKLLTPVRSREEHALYPLLCDCVSSPAALACTPCSSSTTRPKKSRALPFCFLSPSLQPVSLRLLPAVSAGVRSLLGPPFLLFTDYAPSLHSQRPPWPTIRRTMSTRSICLRAAASARPRRLCARRRSISRRRKVQCYPSSHTAPHPSS